MRLTTTTRKPVIFTDLDGTLLDRETYTFEPALPALKVIKQKKIPLLLSSSKTRAEIEQWRQRLGNDHPFISENGGAVFIPRGYFSFPFPCDRETETYTILELGTFYPVILGVLRAIQEETGIDLRGFSDLTEEELSSLCGLGPEEAKLAKQREYDEPFLLQGGEEEIERVKRKIEEKEMNYVWGGRFHHLLGKNDKGRAVEILKKLFEKEFFSVLTIGIGDDSNDLPMLSAVDHPIFLKAEGYDLPDLSSVRGLVVVEGAGPPAWNEAILETIRTLKL